jgi:mRNA interferase MazF
MRRSSGSRYPSSHQRGDVVMVDLEPVAGSEQGRTRPAVVMSNLETIRGSGAVPLYVIIPFTTAGKLGGVLAPQVPARAGGLPADSTALTMHIRSIDPMRVIRTVGNLNAQELAPLERSVLALVGLKPKI